MTRLGLCMFLSGPCCTALLSTSREEMSHLRPPYSTRTRRVHRRPWQHCSGILSSRRLTKRCQTMTNKSSRRCARSKPGAVSGSMWRTVRGKQDEPGGQHPCPNAGFGAEWGRRRETLHQRPWPQPRREETPRQNLHQRPWPRPRREEPLRPRPWPQPRREETPCKNLHQRPWPRPRREEPLRPRPWPRPRREEPLRSRWCRPRPQREKALQPRSRRHHRYRFQAEAMAEVSHGIDRRDFGLLELTVMACSSL